MAEIQATLPQVTTRPVVEMAKPWVAVKEALTPEQAAAQELKRMGEAKRGATEIKGKGVDLLGMGKKKPSEVIAEINGKGNNWNNDSKTRKYVKEAMTLQTELQSEIFALKSQMILKGESVSDEGAITAQAEKNVLARRIETALSHNTPKPAEQPKAEEQKPGDAAVVGVTVTATDGTKSEAQKDSQLKDANDGKPTTPETPEDVEKRQKLEAEKAKSDAVNEAIVKATDAWAVGHTPEEMADLARQGLELAAVGGQVAILKDDVEQARNDLRAAQTNEEAEAARARIEPAKKVLAEAEKQLKAMRAKFEKMKNDPNAPVETRLCAYNLDLAQTTHDQNQVNFRVIRLTSDKTIAEEKIKSEKDPERARAYQQEVIAIEEELTKATSEQESLTAKKRDIEAEKERVGTPEERQVNYFTGMVKKLAEGIPGPEGELPEAKEARLKRQDANIETDAIEFLEGQMGNPANLTAMMDKCGMDQKEQNMILATVAAEAAPGAIKKQEKRGKLASTGKLGLMALLLALYTAYMTNQKKKGGQMG